jgi:hypothetical protein
MLILKNRKTVDAQIEFEQQQKKREEKKSQSSLNNLILAPHKKSIFKKFKR